MTLRIENTGYLPINTKYNNKPQQRKASTTTKVASAIGSTVGVGLGMCAITKKNPAKIVDAIKNPNKIINRLKKLELSGFDVIKIATSSILGGFVAGSATDSHNAKAKAKEGIIQLIGNYIVPSLFVTGGIKLNKVLNKNFHYPPKTGIVQFAFGMCSLVAGVFAGNKISRKLNSEIFQEDTYRPLNWKDWGMQLDNVCLVTSMANEGTSLAKNVSKVIPVAHLVPGYLTGIKQ